MLLFPERLKSRHRRMQSEKAVEVEHGFLGDVDGWPHGVISGLAVGHNDVEAVGCAALEDYYQTPGSAAPKAARVRKLGSAVVPTTASAPLRRKMRLVIGMGTSFRLSAFRWLEDPTPSQRTQRSGPPPTN